MFLLVSRDIRYPYPVPFSLPRVFHLAQNQGKSERTQTNSADKGTLCDAGLPVRHYALVPISDRIHVWYTLPETNIAPENGCLED